MERTARQVPCPSLDQTRTISKLVLARMEPAYWDADARKLTMRAVQEVDAGELVNIDFTIQNPLCNQPSPSVCVRASRIGTDCLDCTQGECLTLSRRAMDRDFVRILSYGTKGHPHHGQTAHYDPSATVTYAIEPPLQGDGKLPPSVPKCTQRGVIRATPDVQAI